MIVSSAVKEIMYSALKYYNSAQFVLSVILHRLYYNDFKDPQNFSFEIM